MAWSLSSKTADAASLNFARRPILRMRTRVTSGSTLPQLVTRFLRCFVGHGRLNYELIESVEEETLVFNTRYGKAFYDQEFNPAFVFVEYLGYLRRNPDRAGFDHWLGKLNLYGNFVDAEMVRSFIVSDEYRGRFNPQ